jgi:hypothetical protein
MLSSSPLKTAERIPDVGPYSIEEDFPTFNKFAGELVSQISSGVNKLPSDKRMQDIRDTLEVVNELLYPKTDKGEFFKRKHEEAVSQIVEVGVDPERVDSDEYFTIKELYEGMIYTYDYLKLKRGEIEDPSLIDDLDYKEKKVKAGARANIAFGDFFMKMHQRFDLTSNQMDELFGSVFGNYDLKRSFDYSVERHFPTGVYAFMHAYLHLLEKKGRQGDFRISNITEDTKHSVDLKWENEGTTEFYEIKTGDPELGFRIVDVTDPTEKELLREDIISLGLGIPKKTLGGMSNLESYIYSKRKEGLTCNGYIMFVPISR